MNWQLQQAKNRLSEVIRQSANDAQTITVRGRETAVVISAERYRQLLGHKESLVDFMQHSPWSKADLDITRSRDTGRDIQL